ncbi:MAG TPA: UDP-N-acetylglucosamine 2-epimerase (non-hydrolyzing) [Candidatus Binataceae bacterium]|nr:UDP-N-acetylglucosamine 2-epimerase (non-hydrolyzing) [Candidatus Binataceae bacterium]
MKIAVVAGARPNFMKVAPLVEALKNCQAGRPDLEILLVHTGQHYDEQMSRAFFNDLGLPRPDVDLGVGSGTHAEQTGRVMIAFEALLLERKPDWVVVVGDVNSTVACALAAKKLGIKVAHVEAGLRSRDWTMPEEVNRVVTDVICDALFTTDPMASDNLKAEGVDPARIHFVGNVMIDTLLKHRESAAALRQWEHLGLEPYRYGVLTLHPPSNVDQPEVFAQIVGALEVIQHELALAFPVHPRTRRMAENAGLWARLEAMRNLRLLAPLGYLEMLSLAGQAAMILTDSGGLQEEAVVLGVPCITLRPNTERPITIAVGANQLVGNDPDAIIAAVRARLVEGRNSFRRPEKWDGLAARRIAEILLNG